MSSDILSVFTRVDLSDVGQAAETDLASLPCHSLVFPEFLQYAADFFPLSLSVCVL